MQNDFNSEASVVTVTAGGDKEWHKNGERHRDDGPAVEYANGTKAWYRDGKLHRDYGPAIEHADGAKLWYRDGLCHRDDGPAAEWAGGTKEWYRYGLRHRDDGPALEWAIGANEWWIEGKQIASFTAQQVADVIAAEEDNREFDKKREMEQTVGSMRDGLPQPITVARPLRLRRS